MSVSVSVCVQDRQPLPPSDMILTFADISTSQRVLGFSPKTSTAEGMGSTASELLCVTAPMSCAGIHHFVGWFKQYYTDRVAWERGGRDPARNALLE